MKIDVVNVVKMKALVKNIKRERPDLVASFSEIAKNKIAEYPRFSGNIGFLTARCIASMENQLKTRTRLFRSALDPIMEAYSKGEYSDEDLRREYCPDVIEVYTDWMRYKFRCSNEYEAYMLMVGDVEGNNVCNAIDAAWTWFHTGFVNNFISKDPETNLLHLNW